MTENNQQLTIFEPVNVRAIADLVPRSYQENTLSHTRCLEAGQALLDRANQEGMSDTLDQEIATFIEKSKVTVKKMNGRRAPVTKMFDQIRKVYTQMENDVDPTKGGSIPCRLQQYRDMYARRKHEEEMRRQREEEARQAKENARTCFRADVEEGYNRQFSLLVDRSIDQLNEMDRQITLENYDTIRESLGSFSCDLPETWCQTARSEVARPALLSPEECAAIEANVMAGMATRFKEQFPFEVSSVRDGILDRLPSKKKELERMAAASAEEAARIKADMEAREQAESAQREAERTEREKQETAAAQLAARKREMDTLFGAPMAVPATYRPKTRVKKKVIVETPDDIMAIVAFWWSQEGCNKSVEELSKEFRKQINFANAAANSKDDPMFISEVRYEDEVKAR